MTITVVHTYFYLGRMHEVAESNILPAPAVIPEALSAQPLAPWDYPLSLLPDIEMEPTSPGLPSVETLPLLATLVIELISTVTPALMAAHLQFLSTIKVPAPHTRNPQRRCPRLRVVF